VSDNGLTVTYQSTADGLKMADLNGESYDAKFAGRDYPVEGDPGHTTVSLKRILRTRLRRFASATGRFDAFNHMRVAKDGKSIQVDFTDKLHRTMTSFEMAKQS
jgi:hypothetical protein